jgi:hypothetical protein
MHRREGNGMILMISNATIVGDGNNIFGHNNSIYGNKNTVAGDNNVLTGKQNKANGKDNILRESASSSMQAITPPPHAPATTTAKKRRKKRAPSPEPAPEPVVKRVARTAPESTADDAPGSPECIICMENKAICAILPCMHKIICIACAQALLAVAEEELVCCPTCRGEIECIKRVYE